MTIPFIGGSTSLPPPRHSGSRDRPGPLVAVDRCGRTGSGRAQQRTTVWAGRSRSWWPPGGPRGDVPTSGGARLRRGCAGAATRRL